MSINTVFDTLMEVENTRGRNAKSALIDELVKDKADKALLAEIITYAQHPFWVYRLTVKGDEPKRQLSAKAAMPSLYASNSLMDSWVALRTILDNLRDRTEEMNVCREAIYRQRTHSAWHAWHPLFTRIINRDLEVGIQKWDRWFKDLFPEVTPMLCKVWDGTINTRMYMEPKMDGLRALAIIDKDGEITWVSRHGKPIWNTDLVDFQLKSLGIRDTVLDGELMARNFGETISITKSQDADLHQKAHLLKFYVFDQLTPSEWFDRKCTATTMDRKYRLYSTIYGDMIDKIVLVPHPLVNDLETISETLADYIRQGFEGAVLKYLDAPYDFSGDHSEYWVKVKPTETSDLEIYDVKEGKGDFAGTLGAIIVRGTVTYRKQDFEVDTSVGSGFKLPQRHELWKLHNQQKLIGQVAEIRFQDPSKVTAKETDKEVMGALRFPVFVRMRPDRIAE